MEVGNESRQQRLYLPRFLGPKRVEQRSAIALLACVCAILFAFMAESFRKHGFAFAFSRAQMHVFDEQREAS